MIDATDGAGAPANDPMPINALQTFLTTHPKVKFVRFQMLDYSTILRVRMTTSSRALQIAADPKGGISTASPTLFASVPLFGMMLDTIVPDEDVWMPDWSSLRECTYAPGYASVMCWVSERHHAAAGEDLARDPRSILTRVVDAAKAQHGVDFLVGFELEFAVMDSKAADGMCATPASVYGSAACRHPAFAVLEETVTLLEEAGVEVWGFHQEGGRGLYELALSPRPPLQAAQDLIFAQEAARAVGARRGLHVTMHPKPFEAAADCGMHTHVSLSRPELGDAFLAGVLRNYAGLGLLANAGYDSYARVPAVGHGWLTWGWKSKVNAVNRKGPAHYEWRLPDAQANTFLMLAGFIGCGMRGVEQGAALTVKANGRITFEWPDEAERAELGVTQRTHATGPEAVEAFRGSETMKEVLGQKAFDAYLLCKERDFKKAKEMTSAERRSRYLEDF